MRRVSILLSLCLFAALAFSASAQASGGTVTGWGYNAYGEVGTGQATSSPPTCLCLTAPVAVPLSGVVQTAGGEYHSLALISDGTVKSWGYNYYGTLGNGSTDTENPVPTTVPGLTGVIAVAASGADSYALLSNGTVMSWGNNEYGQLGIGTVTGPEECSATPCSHKPVLIPGLTNVVSLATSAAADTVYALRGDGTAVAWGEDWGGQLGNGVGTRTGCECVASPTAVPGVSNAIAIAGGESWAMVLLADHSIVAWGENQYGSLGTGSLAAENGGCYCQTATKTLTGVKSIAAGDYDGVAIMLDGSVKVWGYNYYGTLGLGEHTRGTECNCVSTPTTVPAYAGAQAASVNYGDMLVLLADGTVHGAGTNEYGELGDLSTVERSAPVTTYGVGGASAVSLRAYGGSAIIGPSQTLSVAFAGAGTGTVQGGGEINCPTLCTAKYPQGKVAPLTATSTAGGFAGFSGGCTGTATCLAKLETDQTVTATFGVPSGTTITKAKFTGKKKNKATFSFSAPGAITGYQCLLIKPKPKPKKKNKQHKAKASKAKKQKKPQFSACSGPKAYKNLKPGSYTFKVRALDILGADAKPAKRAFKIHPPKKKKAKK